VLLRRTVSRSSLAIGIVAALVGFGADARAEDPSTEQCISTNESGQALRRSGKLQGARAQLLICIAKSCPPPIREDCADRLTEVEKAIPTIVFAVKGPDQQDLAAVRVAMDGAPLVERLDGTALSVDPGEHTFVFTSEGWTPVSKKFTLREGAKGRQESVALVASPPPPPPPSPEPVLVASAPSGAAESESRGGAQRTLAYVLGGAGVVGIGVGVVSGLWASSTYKEASSVSHCPNGPKTCDAAGVSGGHEAHTQATISTLGFVAGGALLAGGVLLFLTAPKDGGLTVQPTASTTGAGIRLGKAW
jgi:hypothetical protein